MNYIKPIRDLSGMKLLSILRRLFAAAAVVVCTAACTREPETISVSATTHNYSQDYLLDILVNGKIAGSVLKPARVGEVKGGGVYCCVDLVPTMKTVRVQIRSADLKEVVTTREVQAKLRQPWPQVASYAVFNVLPDQRVLVEVVPSYLIPEGGRLQELEKAWKEIE